MLTPSICAICVRFMPRSQSRLTTSRELRDETGLSAAVYTQTTDVETECNGLMTYDREILKVDPERIRAANMESRKE